MSPTFFPGDDRATDMGGAPSRILENLWLGGADVLDDFEAFAREKGIDAVVSLGEETVRAGIPKLHLDEQDTPETDLRRHFNAIVNFIHDHRCRGLGVYVHCHAGVSRSGAAAAAYLVAWLDLGVRDALGHLMRCRDTVLPNPGFRDQLLDFADDPATGSLRDQLRRTRGPLLAEDLTDVARELEASRDRVETTRKSEWLYEFSGKPVPEDAEIERDDYGLFVREDGSRCSVARAGAFLAEAEHDWSRSDAAPLDVLDYEGQISRLQAKLAPALRGKRPTPKSGLGWLARPEEKEAWAEPGDAGGDSRRGDDAKGWASDAAADCVRSQVLDEVAPGGREASRGGGEAGDAIDDDDRLPGECLGGCGFFPARGQRFCLHCKALRLAGSFDDDDFDETDAEEE